MTLLILVRTQAARLDFSSSKSLAISRYATCDQVIREAHRIFSGPVPLAAWTRSSAAPSSSLRQIVCSTSPMS